MAKGDIARNIVNQMSAGFALASGANGFFTARPVVPWLQPAGTIEATSFYDTRDLKHTWSVWSMASIVSVAAASSTRAIRRLVRGT